MAWATIAGLVSCNDDYTDWASPQSNDSKEPVDKIAYGRTGRQRH